MATFRLTVLAEEDFDAIGAYSVQVWGIDQAVRYLTSLDQTFTALAQGPGLGKDRSDLQPNLLSCPCNSHVIFFRRDKNNNVEILRILHERMDFQLHL